MTYLDYTVLTFLCHDGLLEKWIGAYLERNEDLMRGMAGSATLSNFSYEVVI